MTIQTNVEDRRALVHRISELLRKEAEYLRAPSYAYAIGPVTVDRDGNIVCEDEQALETLRPFLLEHGYIQPEIGTSGQEPVESEPDTSGHELVTTDEDVQAQALVQSEPDTAEQAPIEPGADALEITVPTDGMECIQLRNLVYMLHAYQYLLNRITRGGTFLVSEDVITHLDERMPVSAADFVSLLKNFVWLEKLRGVDFRADEVTLTFPMDQSSAKNTAYTALTSAIVNAARAAKRVGATERRPENEKYVLRSWLVRLGLGGADSRATRSALLSGLKGHTAFPNEEAAQKHKAKYAEIRKIAREEREGAVE